VSAARRPRRSLMAAAGRSFAVVAVTVLAVACAAAPMASAPPAAPAPPPWAPASSWAPAPDVQQGLSVLGRTTGGRLVLPTAGGPRDFLAGVNLGATTPGTSPGELAITAPMYRRWFAQMGDMGVRVVRIYTIHPPAFYDEIAAYNRAHPAAPLYVMQGVYLPDESYTATGDLFDPGPASAFATELVDAVAAVHGELTRDPQRGRAAGAWRADISPWIAGYIIGVEWDPVSTAQSDERNAAAPAFTGTWFSSGPGATPTERWLAGKMDTIAGAEAAHGRSMPLAFTNWPTTDPLIHPLEPLRTEDLVNVDANRITASPRWPAGQFASYHAYPYYPDFQRYEYDRFEHGGRVDNYAGYLTALRDHHAAAGLPTVISEFGSPSSLGSAHYGPLGRDQGNHSEAEAMAIDAELLGLIHDLGLGGAMVFEWSDEWFKFTWNTIDLQLPADRRSMWHDALTNEQHFGLLAIDAGFGPAVVVDGHLDEWSGNGSRRLVSDPTGAVRELSTYQDEAYLYVGIRFAGDAPWRNQPVDVGFDTVAGGAGSLPAHPGAGAAADVAVHIDAAGAATLLVRPGADPFTQQYGRDRAFFPVDPATVADGSGVWLPRTLIVNRALPSPGGGPERPLESLDVSAMRQGTTDPAAPGFDARNLWATQGAEVELRIPWAAMGFSDPSTSQVVTFEPSGAVAGSTSTPGIGLTVAAGGAPAEASVTVRPWQTTTWAERRKAGSAAVADRLRQLADLPPEGR
jgi:hypothetical protein